MKGKTLVIRLAVLAAVIAVAAVMMVIGRGHTIYLDNKTIEDYQGQEYKSFERVVVTVDGEEAAKLSKRERGMATCMGQSFTMTLEITDKKGDEPRTEVVTVDLPAWTASSSTCRLCWPGCRRTPGIPSLCPRCRRRTKNRCPARATPSAWRATWVWKATWAWRAI